MDSKILFVLLLLPGLAQAVICRTVGADGVTSFTNVPDAECPQGSVALDYGRPQPKTEQAGNVNTGITARRVSFAGYESIEILSPGNGGTVRSNEGRVSVRLGLQPGLQQSHFITAYLDGKAFRGRYGSSEVEMSGVDRGTHKLRVKVSDSGGKTLIESEVISFTLLKVGSAVTVNPITGDDYVDTDDPLIVPVTGTSNVGPVTLRFPVSGKVFGPSEEAGDWEILVPRRVLEGEASFYAEARDGRYTAISTHSIAPGLSSPTFQAPDNPSDYDPPGPADYRPRDGGISTTPGTNPAFKPNYGTQ